MFTQYLDILFVNSLYLNLFDIFIITIFYIVRNIDVIKPLEFVQVIGLWLVYGGYNSIMNYRDRKMDHSPPIDDSYDSENLDEDYEDEDTGKKYPKVDNPD